MKNNLVWAFLFILCLPLVVQARELVKPSGSANVDVIDTPTADVVDHYGYNVSFRFGKEGNIQNKSLFGLFPRLNMGFGLDGEKIIGTDNARLNKPTINIKFRLFDGKDVVPALALGFDGQGYVFNKTLDEYEQREKGFYLVGTWHPIVPEFQFNLGADIFDFDHGNPVRGFTGASYTYEHIVALLAEWDNFDFSKERRINYGAKIYITPVFTVDLLGRNIPKYSGAKSRETERIVRLGYTGSF